MSVVVNISHVVFHVNHDFKIISCVSLYKIRFVKKDPGSFDYFNKLVTPYKDER